MNIKRLVIENFKSIERIELIEPNPFTVFVGPNGSGKSNIFEALEFGNRISRHDGSEAFRLFGGTDSLSRRGADASANFQVVFEYDEEPRKSEQFFNLKPEEKRRDITIDPDFIPTWEVLPGRYQADVYVIPFIDLFSRIAIYENKPRIDFQDGSVLNTAATNLEPVLKRIFSNNILKEEIFEWLNLFISEFKSVDVIANSFDGSDTLLWYEHFTEKPFTKRLISDGTKNILTLLAAVYQSDEPQFLCIEEPENGLHPEVLESLINFFRNQCIEKGHYIWLNTHSESIVKLLTTDEIILVNKRDGATQTKQVKGMNIYSLTTDEAWLSGALGGGLTW